MKKNTLKQVERKVRAQAKCASFDIEISATFKPHGLGSEEVNDVQRKLRNNLSNAIAKLPFAHVYPCEIKVR